MIFWRVRFNCEEKPKIIEDFYKDTTDQEKDWYKLKYDEGIKNGKYVFSCAYEIEGKECACQIILRKGRKNSEMVVELARRAKDRHKPGCESETILYDTETVIEKMNIKDLFELYTKTEKKLVPIKRINDTNFKIEIEPSENAQTLDEIKRIPRKRYALDRKSVFDHYFLRNKVDPKINELRSQFEIENFTNCIFSRSFDTTSEWFINPRKNNFIKWNWNQIPKIQEDNEKFYIFIAVNKIRISFEHDFKDISKSDYNTKKWIKIRINSKETREKLGTLRNQQERENIKIRLSLLTERPLSYNVNSIIDLEEMDYEHLKIQEVVPEYDEFFVYYNGNEYFSIY